MLVTPPNILKSILRLYEQNEETLRLDITKLKNWMTTQVHLPEILGKSRVTTTINP